MSPPKEVLSYEDFAQSHGPQFANMGLPEVLWCRVFNKLYPEEISDMGESFQLQTDGQGYGIVAKADLRKEAEVWVVDHALTCDGGELTTQQFIDNSHVVERFCLLNNIPCPATLKAKAEKEEVQVIDIDESLDEDVVNMVMEQANVSRERAITALKAEQGEMLNAIIRCKTEQEGLEESEHKINERLRKEMEAQQEESEDEDDGDDVRDFYVVNKNNRHRATFEDFQFALEQERAENGVKDKIADGEAREMFLQYRLSNGLFDARHYTDRLTWRQNLQDGTIEVVVPLFMEENETGDCYDTYLEKGSKAVKVVSKLSRRQWSLTLNGKKIFENKLFPKTTSGVDADSSLWKYNRDDISITMVLEKKDPDEDWPELFEKDDESDELLTIKRKSKSLAYKQLQSNRLGSAKRKELKQCAANLTNKIKESNLTYQIAALDANGAQTMATNFYVMDEFGSAIEPVKEDELLNTECHPFINIFTGISYSLVWLSKDIKESESCKRKWHNVE